MNKTADIEQMVLLWLDRGPLTVDAVAAEFRTAFVGEQLTWLGIAMHQLERDGRVRYPSCSAGHNHDGPCLAELAR